MIQLHDPALYPPYAAPEPEPYPEPVVRSDERFAMPEQRPRPVVSMEKAAIQQGWTVLVQYARGWMPHATHGRPGAAPVDMWAVRMRKGDRGAVAVRTGAAWDMLYTWSPTEPWHKHATVGAFTDAICGGE